MLLGLGASPAYAQSPPTISKAFSAATVPLNQRIDTERVRLTEGPMEGFAGIFDHYRSGSKRVALLLNVVGASMKVVVPASSVAAAPVD